MHVRLMYPNEYLCAADLRGKEVTLTISQISQENLRREDGSQDPAWVVDFKEMEGREGTDKKRFVLNKTNAMRIASHHGSESADWPGKQITLYPTTTPAFGEIVECIRVKERLAKSRRAE